MTTEEEHNEWMEEECPNLVERNQIEEEFGTIMRFLEWLAYESDYTLATGSGHELRPAHTSDQEIAHDFFGLDHHEVEQERQKLLERIRDIQGEEPIQNEIPETEVSET